MSFQENDLPPIFNIDAPEYDRIITDKAITRKYTKKELEEKLIACNINSDGGMKDQRKRAAEVNIPMSELSGKIIGGYVGKLKGCYK